MAEESFNLQVATDELPKSIGVLFSVEARLLEIRLKRQAPGKVLCQVELDDARERVRTSIWLQMLHEEIEHAFVLLFVRFWTFEFGRLDKL